MSKEMAVFTFITAFNSLPLFHFSALNIISSMFFGTAASIKSY